MNKATITNSVCFALSLLVVAQVQAYETYTLYNVHSSTTARLIDYNGSLVKFWQCTRRPSASMPYLILPDSTVFRAQTVPFPPMNGAGAGGHIQLFDWDGNLLWEYYYTGQNYQHHHDIQPLPDGNVMLVAWDRKTKAEAEAMGRVNINGEMWPTAIIEVDPSNDSIVWEWHIWDHMIQDVDPGKPNYGVIYDHPELLDINFGNLGSQGGDWLHTNFMDYNPELDQIIFSSHNLNEIYIIDHSTTTEEAASHSGGNSGMGGDLLYRWGNPQAYDRGTSADQHFYVVHGVNWIDPGLQGEGNILMFNNGDRPGSSNDYSSVEEIIPPLTGYNYYIHPDSAFGPKDPTWIYSNPGTFFSRHLSGAFRLSNGNTFICEGTKGHLFEVTSSGQVVWNFYTGGELENAGRYDLDATGVEEKPSRTTGKFVIVHISPNPFKGSTTIKYQLSVKSRVLLRIYDITGRVVKTLVNSEKETGEHNVKLDAKALTAGTYFAKLSVTNNICHHEDTKTLILVR